MSWEYGPLATEVYDLDKPIGHSFGDVEYYTRLLATISGRILEPATGTGRILILLLEAGHRGRRPGQLGGDACGLHRHCQDAALIQSCTRAT